MKKIFKISLVLVGLVSTLNASAGNSSLILNLKKAEGKKVSFTLNEMKKVKLSIYDSSDDLIFKEDVTGHNLFRTYDLEALPEGDYIMEAESDLKVSKYKLVVKDRIAILSPEADSEFFKPVFEYNKATGKLAIIVENNSKIPVLVTVYDKDKELLYTNSNTATELSRMSFDLKNLKKDCTFVVCYEGKTFEKNISL